MMVFVALLIAHLLGDFVLQRSAVVDGKHQGRWQSWVEHGAVHLICLLVAWLLFSSMPLLDYKVGIAFALIVATHLFADWVKVRRGAACPLAAFVLDQAFHVLVLLVFAIWIIGDPDILETVTTYWLEFQFQAGLIVTAYLVGVIGCGWLNRHLLDSLYPDPTGNNEHDASAGLARAGLRIGWLERFLMLSAFLVQAWAALGLVLAAKSVFRFEDIKKGRRHAEYFLIGTLISVVEVVLVGMLLLSMLSLTGELP
jgi:hypothetical protein